MTARRTLRAGARRAAAVAVAAALAAPGLLTLAAAPASAHNVLVGTNPPADRTLAEPLDQVTLTFDDVVLDLGGEGGGTALDVTGPDGTHHATACPSVVDTTVSAPVALGEAGTYTVAYRVVSADGHPISGRYQFDYAPPEGTPATAGTAAAACGASDGAASDAGTAAPEARDGTGADAGTAATVTGTTWGVSPGAAIGIAAGTAVVGAAAVLVALRLARRR